MKTGPSTKILFHWILVFSIIALLLYYDINKIGLAMLIGFLLLTLIFNQATFLNLKNGKLIITKKNFLFISTFQLSIDLDKTVELTIIDYRENNPENLSSIVDFEAVILVDILTGTYFYKPTNKLVIELTQNNFTEVEINTRRKDIIRIKQVLKKFSLSRFIA